MHQLLLIVIYDILLTCFYCTISVFCYVHHATSSQLLCGRSNMLHYACCLSVCLAMSVCPVRFANWKITGVEKN